eukprot:TRINITY_DN277_c1_g2_i1.p1 TRINITY_DN277_c1_g2~~TRINITY_DN277_c1_g2_i1.p1  ORF type:complete len:809 (-),score=177.62 TRINITY_DN277_c1_g2_i1:143-2569(-)
MKNTRKSVDAHSLKETKDSKKAVQKEKERKEKDEKKKNKKELAQSNDKDGAVKREKSNRELKDKEKERDREKTGSGGKKGNTEKKLLAVVCNFVVDEPFVAPLFLKFVRSSQAEEIAHELVNMFYAKHKHTEAIVEDAIFYVAQEYPNGNELLRSTNIFVAVLSECARLGGHRYLTRVLGPHVKRICGHEGDGETDSLQLWNNDQSKNTPLIVEYATAIMDKIMGSAPNLPMFLKQMMIALHKSMSRNKSNPVSGSMLISAFLFLRFICPALVSPHCYGLVRDAPTIAAQRMLVSIAKMLQAVVNNKIDNPHAHLNHNNNNHNTPSLPTKPGVLTKTSSGESSEALGLPSASSLESTNSSDSELSSNDTQRNSNNGRTHEEPTGENEHEIAVNAFIIKYSIEVEVYASAVLDKKGDCDGKRFYKVTQQKEYGRAALEWMQGNKEHLVDYLMKNKQIRDKLAFEQFLSKVSNGELDGNSRSPRLFKGSMGLGRRKKDADAKDEEAYEKHRLHYKRELKKTKRKEEEKALARNKEKENSRDHLPILSSASATSTPIERTQSATNSGSAPGSPAVMKKETVSSGAISTRGGSLRGSSQIGGVVCTDTVSPNTTPVSSPLSSSVTATLNSPTKNLSSELNSSLGSGGGYGHGHGSLGNSPAGPKHHNRLLSPSIDRGRSDSWVFLTDDSDAEDEDERSDPHGSDLAASRRRYRRPSVGGRMSESTVEEGGGRERGDMNKNGRSGLSVSTSGVAGERETGTMEATTTTATPTTTTGKASSGPGNVPKKGKEVEDAEAVCSSDGAPASIKAVSS